MNIKIIKKLNKRDQTLEQNKDFLNKRLEKINERYDEDENIEKLKKRKKSQITTKNTKNKKKNRSILGDYKFKNRNRSSVVS